MKHFAWVPILFLVCCNKPAPAETPAPPAASPSSEAKPAAPAAAPAAPAAAAPSAGETLSAGGLTWSAGAPFHKRQPKSTMRVAEYGVDGDDTGELTVFYFGSDQGGGVEKNMARWVSQFKQPDGSETQAKRSERTVNDTDVALIEATGTYSGGMAMPGMPSRGEQANAAMLGAIAKGPKGDVFFKLVGSKSGVEQARSSFDALIASIRKAE